LEENGEQKKYKNKTTINISIYYSATIKQHHSTSGELEEDKLKFKIGEYFPDFFPFINTK
jgi:hypothetical protein